MVDQYFKVFRGKKWYFTASALSRDGRAIHYSLTHLTTIPIERHVKVTGKASPDDPTLRTYWQQRQTRQGKTYWAKGSKYYQIAEKQNWQCPVCEEHLFNGEQLHTHHVLKVTDGGTDRVENLLHSQGTCTWTQPSESQEA